MAVGHWMRGRATRSKNLGGGGLAPGLCLKWGVVWHEATVLSVCLWRRLLGPRHCSF